jgi:DNA-binding transcriptional MerR regulator
MRIGELAAKAAVNIQTVRFYERKEILKNPPRSISSDRCYGQADLEAPCFIRWSQELGFSLHEISQLLPLHCSIARFPSPNKPGPREMREMAVVARQRSQQVDRKLRLLKTIRTQLVAFITQPETTAPIKCPRPANASAQQETSLTLYRGIGWKLVPWVRTSRESQK